MMKLSIIIAALGTIALTTTIPKRTPFTATFDDVDGSAIVPELFLVPTPYRSLKFDGFDVYNTALPGLKASSGDQVAATFNAEEIITGALPPKILITGSTKYFDLLSVKLGSVVESQTGLVPLKSTLVFTAKKVNGQTFTKSCPFTGGNQLQPCTFSSSFAGVTEVSVQFSDLVEFALGVIFLDDVKGNTYQ